VTEDSAFKKQVRARMAETGEKYSLARRMLIAGRGAGRRPVVVRVYLNPHVDFELTAADGRAYAAADEQGRRQMAGRLLAAQAGVAESGWARVAAESKILTDEELRADEESAQDAAIRGAVQRCLERVAGVSAVRVDRTTDRLRVSIRAARPILLAGHRGMEAERLRGELEELTGGRVRLDIAEEHVPHEGTQSESFGRTG
jgi:hypothetical protein